MEKDGRRLVIFDCDGVLVDSEPISLAVLVDAFGQAGVTIDADYAHRRFLGKSLAAVIATARDEFSLEIGEPFLLDLRNALYARFRSELKPMPGIAEALDALAAAGIRWCVASSSQPERIALSLTVTGLMDRLSPHLFSATMVKNGKPAPDLFLHAAAAMGFAPRDCVVIEDSPAGIMAAKAAGMTVFAFTGGSHTTLASYRDEIAALKPDRQFDDMVELLHLMQK